jgi:hypothetical protein
MNPRMSWVKPRIIHNIIKQKSSCESKKFLFSRGCDIKTKYFETVEGIAFLNSMIITVNYY